MSITQDIEEKLLSNAGTQTVTVAAAAQLKLSWVFYLHLFMMASLPTGLLSEPFQKEVIEYRKLLN